MDFEKYTERSRGFVQAAQNLALARDANAAGDRIASENYLQHAEHYYRLINNSTDGHGDRHRQAPRQDGNGHDAEAAVGSSPGGDAAAQDEATEGTA